MTRTGIHPRLAVDRLRRAQHVLLTSHRNPDGDAIGSEVALAELATHLGLDVEIVNRDPVPTPLGELPGVELVRVLDALPDDAEDRYDLVVTVDCPGADRPGFEGLTRMPILNIDHHRANPCFGEVNYVDEEAPAVGEMVWRMFADAEVRPSLAATTNMYVALTTDTGDFRHSNATARAFRTAAEMVDAGARPEVVADWIHAGRSAASVRLLGEALRTLTLGHHGQLAVLEVDESAFLRSGAEPGDTDGIIDLPRRIAEVRVVALLKQWEPGIVRVSLRSKGSVDVCAIARQLGGGGHTNAAGCTVHGDMSTARVAVTTLLEDALGGVA